MVDAAARQLPCPRIAVCRQRSAPTSDSEIKIEVWMPATGWNGKFQGVGNGAWLGFNHDQPHWQPRFSEVTPQPARIPVMKGAARVLPLGHPEKLIDLRLSRRP